MLSREIDVLFQKIQMRKKREKMNKRGSLAITQILILLIGIFAFSFIIGEIGKSQGIEVARGVGIVSGYLGFCSDLDKTLCQKADGCRWSDALEICTETTDPLEQEELPEKETPIDPTIYRAGQMLSAKNEETGEIEKHRINKEDVDENGKIKKDPSEGLKNWAINTGVSFGTGLLTDAAGKAIAGKGGKLLTSNAQYAGPAIGAFLAWALFKWAFKADVRNMRTITPVALIAGAAGTITAIAIGSAAVPGIGWIVGGIVLVFVLLVGLFTSQQYSKEVFSYIVDVWEPPSGGDSCELCNKLEFGCTEYQCRSFGKGCEIVNPGSVQEVCVWKDPDDIFPPEITALEKVLLSDDYEYRPLSGVVTGVQIFYKKDSSANGCVPPYTSVTLGVETNKFADCKIDTDRTPSYKDMTASMTSFEGFEEEHILELPHVATPSVEGQENAGVPITEITNGQNQEFFIRCESANGISNTDEYIMEFCVQDGPDAFPPIILGTNFLENSFLQYNQSEAHFEIYTNEPAECKWSFEDLDYEAMQFEMDQCSEAEGDFMFPPFKYGCIGNLAGLKDRVENKIYAKCKDKPWWTEGSDGARYANEQSHLLTLKGTEPIVIDEITVNGKRSGAIIKDSVSTINVKLEAKAKFGADNGKSICQYEFGGNWINFYNEGSAGFVNVNTQRIPLSEGFYNYSIRCFDAGLNSDEGNIEFTILKDNQAPIVARAYYDVNNLKVITNEPAECVYTTQQNIACDYNFDDGVEMNKIGESTHYTSWQANKKYFIKCKDEFGNQPLPGQCSIIVKAFESFK